MDQRLDQNNHGRASHPSTKGKEKERDFWQSHYSTEYVDWNKAERLTLANLKPSVKTISLRLPESMLEELKLLANKRDAPYQSLVKVFLSDRIEQELTGKAGHNKPSQRIADKSG
jgi:predicted DNA binding CopG/RHH family protein